MKYRSPGYCRGFRCKAGECRDSCCRGWEIDIDSETAARYEKAGGAFGERLRSSIHSGAFVLTEDERCPFLNAEGLCDIYINLGRDSLCRICSEHPRYYEWFGSVKEGGIGLCCEAAAELILSQPFSLCEEEVPDEEASGSCDEELFAILLEAREEMLKILEKGDIPLSEALCGILDTASEVQEQIDIPYPVYSGDTCRPGGAYELFRIFAALEPIDENWLPYVDSCEKTLPSAPPYSEEYAPYLRRLASYFVFRYFMKSAYDGRALGYAVLAAVSVLFISLMFRCEAAGKGCCGFNDCAELAKNYSKETEYCEENIEQLLEAFGSEPVFGIASLKELIAETFGENVGDI